MIQVTKEDKGITGLQLSRNGFLAKRTTLWAPEV
jgi:hypothetical protein